MLMMLGNTCLEIDFWELIPGTNILYFDVVHVEIRQDGLYIAPYVEHVVPEDG